MENSTTPQPEVKLANPVTPLHQNRRKALALMIALATLVLVILMFGALALVTALTPKSVVEVNTSSSRTTSSQTASVTSSVTTSMTTTTSVSSIPAGWQYYEYKAPSGEVVWALNHPTAFTPESLNGLSEGYLALKGDFKGKTYTIELSFPRGVFDNMTELIDSTNSPAQLTQASITTADRDGVEMRKVVNLPVENVKSYKLYIWSHPQNGDTVNPSIISIVPNGTGASAFVSGDMQELLDGIAASVKVK